MIPGMMGGPKKDENKVPTNPEVVSSILALIQGARSYQDEYGQTVNLVQTEMGGSKSFGSRQGLAETTHRNRDGRSEMYTELRSFLPTNYATSLFEQTDPRFDEHSKYYGLDGEKGAYKLTPSKWSAAGTAAQAVGRVAHDLREYRDYCAQNPELLALSPIAAGLVAPMMVAGVIGGAVVGASQQVWQKLNSPDAPNVKKWLTKHGSMAYDWAGGGEKPIRATAAAFCTGLTAGLVCGLSSLVAKTGYVLLPFKDDSDDYILRAIADNGHGSSMMLLHFNSSKIACMADVRNDARRLEICDTLADAILDGFLRDSGGKLSINGNLADDVGLVKGILDSLTRKMTVMAVNQSGALAAEGKPGIDITPKYIEAQIRGMLAPLGQVTMYERRGWRQKGKSGMVTKQTYQVEWFEEFFNSREFEAVVNDQGNAGVPRYAYHQPHAGDDGMNPSKLVEMDFDGDDHDQLMADDDLDRVSHGSAATSATMGSLRRPQGPPCSPPADLTGGRAATPLSRVYENPTYVKVPGEGDVEMNDLSSGSPT